ncbi:MAG: hypothetical protein HGA38_05665 [Candidatus Moranbacteria bacterium]|nr:hypothetical protein [Candidatus Moranbacteria bacterium]NTW46414.1 hypothetical protein [Candidatus Moranbacteria bacterium]
MDMGMQAALSDDPVSAERNAGTGQGGGEEHIRFGGSRAEKKPLSETGDADVFGAGDEGDESEDGFDGVSLL